MCSDPRVRQTPRTASTALLVLVVLGALLLGACGKKGDPLPPLRNVPLKSNDLELRQQGRMLFFELGYPSTTASGLALGGIDALELYELVKATGPDGDLPTVDPREFEGAAQSILTLRGSELTSTVTGDRIQIRMPMADELPSEPSSWPQRHARTAAARPPRAWSPPPPRV